MALSKRFAGVLALLTAAILIVGFGGSDPLWAQSPGGSGIAIPDAADGVWPSLWRLIGSLALVLVVAWTVLHFAKRFVKGRNGNTNSPTVKLVDRTYIAPRKSIDLVTVGGRTLVLGVTESQISFLTELPPTTETQGPPVPGSEPKTETSFYRQLAQKLGMNPSGGKPEAAS